MSETKTETPYRRYDDICAKASDLDKISISIRCHKLLNQLLQENPKLDEIMIHSSNEVEAQVGVKIWITGIMEKSPEALEFYSNENSSRKIFESLKWTDYATIRLLDYIDNAGREFEDLNLRGAVAVNNPIKMIWLAARYGTGGAKPYFFEDMLHLFRQLGGNDLPPICSMQCLVIPLTPTP